MHQTKTHIVPKLAKSIRLQEYGVGIFNLVFTKSALKKALKKQYITVNGIGATSATFISGGETICLTIPESNKPRTKLILKLNVIFEDDYLAIVHKPGGILVSGNSFKTIANALIQNLKPSNLLDRTTPQPVHRLDYPTTGLLLIGKTNSSIRALNKLFEDKKIKKSYYAVTIGEMQPKGEITTDIDNKPSQSHYKVKTNVLSERFGMLNLVKLKPKTGRKHQLRKHLLSIGNPILGDKDYNIEHLILNGKGLYLHAYSLKFTHPFTQEKLSVKDVLPEKFKKIFDSI
ncbi:RluA family pseudouridine synthase [Lacinutrix sp. Bg11-31]|uniref:RluA family pseudouridine synthase n=1 Tax=Lacinutrix sp. Bg11-31 TaxID=2057808 RepID=UPI000C30D4BC|nr:RluA family pseudouridine synthase [Lacinutrix sp. Bg11-31]AUC82431.1 RNA pseudouridine synthase [Lacinutrix sp. Bg11-31]